jgi:formylglycine-generating enzyme required for sulfatase activity
MVSWYDAVVWCNALSEMMGKSPVYRTGDGDVIRSSVDAHAGVVEAAVATGNKGFRLPTEWEWELAARWKHDAKSTDGSILNNRRYWTPGNYASGAAADYNNAGATQLAALYNETKTHDVGSKPSGGNHLGIYDMSGNVWEWCWDVYAGTFRVVRGGAWFNSADYVTVAYRCGNIQNNLTNNTGFRVVCSKD